MIIPHVGYVEYVGSRNYSIEKKPKDMSLYNPISKIRILTGYLYNRWTLGCILSVVFIWMVSALLCDSSEPYTYDSDTQSWIIKPGSTIFWRSEGWGRSYFGKFGLGVIPDITKDKNEIVMIWGDSFVEALPTDDDEKMTQQLTKMLETDGQNLICTSRAMGGDNIADYILNIPQYEKQIPAISCHIIFITGIEDIMPDLPSDTRCMFRSEYGYELLKSKEKCKPASIKNLINELRLFFTLPLIRIFTRDFSLRFSLGPVKEASESAEQIRNNYITNFNFKEACDFLVEQIKEATNKSVVVIYMPDVPRIEDNKVNYNDPDRFLIKNFADSCRSSNIEFIDLYYDCIDYYEDTGEFLRGFPNSCPGQGHLNTAGHRLVAEALYKYLRRSNYDFYSD